MNSLTRSDPHPKLSTALDVAGFATMSVAYIVILRCRRRQQAQQARERVEAAINEWNIDQKGLRAELVDYRTGGKTKTVIAEEDYVEASRKTCACDSGITAIVRLIQL